jgi:DNA repair protein RadC
MGPAKYAQILASLEMGTRYLDSQLKTGQALGRSQAVKDYISTQLRGEHREVFAVLCLDNALNLLNFEILFTGGISSCSVCIKHVLRHALSHAASQLIIAHNHPHTDAKPSTADNLLTYELKKACDLLDISLVDHIIVGRNDTLSYAESCLAPFG